MLFVSRMCPFPEWDGESIRTGSLLKGLACRHRITLVTRVRNDDEQQALRREQHLFVSVHPFRFAQMSRTTIARRALGSPKWWLLPVRVPAFCFEEIGAAVKALLASDEFDCVVLDHKALAHYLAFVPGSFRGIRVLNLHNLESLLQRRAMKLSGSLPLRLLGLADAVRMRLFEGRMLPRFDCILSASSRETAIIRARAPGVEVIDVPNGIARTRPIVDAGGSARELNRILFVGTLNYLPNEDGICWFVSRILPLIRARVPGAMLTIVGHRPTPRLRRMLGPGTELHESPETVEAFYQRAAVAVVPLRAGSGSRHKILEALVHRVPVVTTGIGAEGLELEPGRHYLRADGVRTFASAVERAIADPAAGAAQVDRALPIIRERYSSVSIARSASDVLAALVDRRAAARRLLSTGSACAVSAG